MLARSLARLPCDMPRCAVARRTALRARVSARVSARGCSRVCARLRQIDVRAVDDHTLRRGKRLARHAHAPDEWSVPRLLSADCRKAKRRTTCSQRPSAAINSHLVTINNHLATINSHLAAINIHLAAINSYQAAINTRHQ